MASINTTDPLFENTPHYTLLHLDGWESFIWIMEETYTHTLHNTVTSHCHASSCYYHHHSFICHWVITHTHIAIFSQYHYHHTHIETLHTSFCYFLFSFMSPIIRRHCLDAFHYTRHFSLFSMNRAFHFLLSIFTECRWCRFRLSRED